MVLNKISDKCLFAITRKTLSKQPCLIIKFTKCKNGGFNVAYYQHLRWRKMWLISIPRGLISKFDFPQHWSYSSFPDLKI